MILTEIHLPRHCALLLESDAERHSGDTQADKRRYSTCMKTWSLSFLSMPRKRARRRTSSPRHVTNLGLSYLSVLLTNVSLK